MTLHKHRKNTCKNSVKITTERDSNIKQAQAKTRKINTYRHTHIDIPISVFFIEGMGRSPPLPPGIDVTAFFVIGNRYLCRLIRNARRHKITMLLKPYCPSEEEPAYPYVYGVTKIIFYIADAMERLH